MNNYSFLKKVISGLFFGCVLTSLYIQNSDRSAKVLASEIQKMFKRDLKAHFFGDLTSISFFPLAMTLKNVYVVPVDSAEKWDWKADQIDISFSLFSYFFTKKIGFEMDFYNAIIHSDMVNDQPSIKKHIDTYLIISSMAMPFVPEKIHTYNTQIFVQDKSRFQECMFSVNGEMIWENEKMRGNIKCSDGMFSSHDQIFIKDIQGAVSVDTKILYQKYLYPVEANISFKVPFLPQEKQMFVFNGTWDGYKGNCSGNNKDSSFVIKKAVIAPYKKIYALQVDVECDASLSAYLAGYNKKASAVQGVINLSLAGTTQKISGILYGKSVGYGNYFCDISELFFQTDATDVQGAITFYHKEQLCNGTFFIDGNNKTGDCTLKATTPWNIFDQWYLEPYMSTLSFFLTKEGSFLCTHALTAMHQKTKRLVHAHGDMKLASNGLLDCKGAWSDKTYQGKLELFPQLKPYFFWCKNKQSKSLFTLTGHYPEYSHFDARLSYDMVRELMRECFDYDVPGEGNLVCNGKLEKDQIKIDINARDITAAIPETYNFISGIKGSAICSYDPFKIIISDVLVSLHKGTVKADTIVAEWDEYNNLETVHMPLRFHNCFFNAQKDFFALLSGDITVKKEKDANFLLTGLVKVEKGQLKENPLSLQGQKEVTQFMMPSDFFKEIPLDLSIKLLTGQSVYINTPFLTSRAAIDVYLQNTLTTPFLSGTLQLQGGALHFPYKSLSILNATVTFLPHQLYDPLVTIVARATVKKYTITLTVTGSLEVPHIALDAVPYLAEEQIIALLFSGTVEETLPGMVPAFLVHSLENLLFGSSQYVNESDSFLKDSLKKIRLIPRFSDQTGRGGVRGAIEIDVSDRLHAMIQKNFSLTEDTRFEIEYIVSDDISVKGVKDERGDIGGELEMRFKF